MTITSIDDSQRTAAKVAGFAYLLSLATEVVSEFRIKPHLVVNLWWFDTPMGIFEIATSFWLLFRGLGASRLPQGAHA